MNFPNYSEEQKKILKAGFAEHDFTKDVSLYRKCPVPAKQAPVYTALKERVKGYMQSSFPEMGIKPLYGLSATQPVNLLVNTDASYIAEKAMGILQNEQQTEDAVEQFFSMFDPLIDGAVDSFCQAKGKTPDELTEEDAQRILDRVTEVVNETLMNAVMQGQQFQELNEIAHGAPAHEDFNSKTSHEWINFCHHWEHDKTLVGAVLSLDGFEDITPSDFSTDEEYSILRNAFCETLDDTDAEIFRLREVGYTQAEIADRLGFKNHSAVTKHLKSMREKFDGFISEIEHHNE